MKLVPHFGLGCYGLSVPVHVIDCNACTFMWMLNLLARSSVINYVNLKLVSQN